MQQILTLFLCFQIVSLPLTSQQIEAYDVKDLVGIDYSEEAYHDEAMKTHFNYYYELLISKHRPDLRDEWNEVEREKEAILKKWKEYSKEKQTNVCEEIPEEWYVQHDELQNRFFLAVKDRDEQKIKMSLGHILVLKKHWNELMIEVLKES